MNYSLVWTHANYCTARKYRFFQEKNEKASFSVMSQEKLTTNALKKYKAKLPVVTDKPFEAGW